MTSSERHLNPNQARWNYEIHKYKNIKNVFYEHGLISIIVLAHGRPEFTQASINSTIDCISDYPGEIEWIFIENGNNEENYNFFKNLNLERKVIVRQKNYGINEGINQGWALSRGEYVMIHENDWITVCKYDFLSMAKNIFEINDRIGIVQLRDAHDPNENWGFGKPEFNPWTCSIKALEKVNIQIHQDQTSAGESYFFSNFPNGFSNNPIIMRKDVYYLCGPYPEAVVGSDPRHGETQYQEKVAKTKYLTAYCKPIYRHIGNKTTHAT